MSVASAGYGKPLALVIIASALAFVALLAGLDVRQTITIAVITLMIAGIILYWERKVSFASFGLFLLFLTGGLDVEGFIRFSHLDVIIFLTAMMIMVEFLERTAFFESIVNFMVGCVCRGAYSLIALFFLMSALFASLVGVITAVLFMVPMILDIAVRYRVRATPLLLIVVFAANIGSSATAVGNPVGVLLAFAANLTFSDFLRWATPVTLVVLLLSLTMILLIYRDEISQLDRAIAAAPLRKAKIGEVMGGEQIKAWLLFLAVLIPIILQDHLEKILGLRKGSMLLGAAVGGATAVLFYRHGDLEDILREGVEWPILLFFIFLFSSVGALEHVGLTELLANAIISVGRGNMFVSLLVIALIAAFLSAFLDNVLTVAFFIPVIEHMAELGVDVFPLWWGLLFAGTYFGNLTTIASTANIVALGFLEARGLGNIDFTEWLKNGVYFSVFPLLVALLLLSLQIVYL